MNTSPTKLYHGTSSRRLEHIAGDGLRPQKSGAGCYLTNNILHAIGYADYAADIDRESTDTGETDPIAPVVLEIDFVRLDAALLRSDDYELSDLLKAGADPRLTGYASSNDVPWRVSLAVCEQVAYAGQIPWIALRTLEAEQVDSLRLQHLSDAEPPVTLCP